MTDQHLLTPPPELVQQWHDDNSNLPTGLFALGIATQAARWGADQELEACCHLLWLQGFDVVADLRASRRPKPSSLKEQALAALAAADGADHPIVVTVITADQHSIIRRALEALPE